MSSMNKKIVHIGGAGVLLMIAIMLAAQIPSIGNGIETGSKPDPVPQNVTAQPAPAAPNIAEQAVGGLKNLGIDTAATEILNNKEALKIEGWALLEKNTDSRSVNVILKSPTDEKTFACQITPRSDVKDYFKTDKTVSINTDKVGFVMMVYTEEIPHGEYEIGVYVKDGDLEGLSWSDKKIVIKGK